jgi:hypothetical protein
MFGVNWSDPQTFWLNMTNLGLGLVALIAVLAIGYGIVWDLMEKRQASRRVDGEMKRMLAGMEHAFHSPELGMTMADGGEPEQKPGPSKPSKKAR